MKPVFKPAIEIFFELFFAANTEKGNRNSAFVCSFSSIGSDEISKEVLSTLRLLEKHIAFSDCRGKTVKQVFSELLGFSSGSLRAMSHLIRESLRKDDKVYVLQHLSKAKRSSSSIGYRDHAGTMRDLMKTLDDTHFKGYVARGNLVFIDFPSFIEKNADALLPYLSFSPILFQRAPTTS